MSGLSLNANKTRLALWLYETCGGYIGLFLGYALIQFPRLIENGFLTLKHKISTHKSISCQIQKLEEME